MSATTAKPFQPYTSALNTTASGASTSNAYQFIQIPRSMRRSHTAERSYRKMDPLESSFHYDRPPKSEALKELVQSPFINGKRNENYINPTYYSSNFMNQSMEVQRGRLREHQSVERSNSLNNSKGFIAPRPVPNTTAVQREILETPKKSAPVNDIAPVEGRYESDSKTFARNASVKKVEIKVERDQPREPAAKTPSQASQAGDDAMNVCDGCYNWGLAYEGAENRKKSRATELAMERAVMEYNNQQLRLERERETERKEAVLSASRYNQDTFTQKKARAASRERIDVDGDVDIKPHSKNFAPESLRSLQRYQSMLDKMYEQSVKKISDRKSDLNKSQNHNKNMISKNEDLKSQEKLKLVAWNDGGNEKSLLDRMHDNSAHYGNAKAYEKRRASEYNHRTGNEVRHIRNSSPTLAGPVDDPFKRNAADCEESVVKSKSILDKMYQSSFDYWRRQKEGLKESSKANKDMSSSRKHRNDFDDEAFSSSRGGERQRGMLDSIYASDEKGLDHRKNGTRDCSSHNRYLGYSDESALAKAKTMESYYKSPAKKVGESNNVDYDQWTHENSGVISRINLAAEKLEQDRKAQVMDTGYSLKNQINECLQRKKDEHVRDRAFKETPLLVCSHKANLMYCNICNRKVPMNKITKIIGDYKKIMKNKGLSSGR